jgi:diaminopimelate decarboxylase
MDDFVFRDGSLHAEAVRLSRLAERAGTPTFVYSAATLRRHVQTLKSAFAELDPLVCFSVKSCPNLGVLRTVADAGCGMDVVSPGELQRALAAGVPAARVAYAGVGKTRQAIEEAVTLGVGCINIESAEELELVARVCAELRRPASLALRVNPDVDAGTHRHTTTGVRTTKFGVGVERAEELFDRLRDHSFARLEGLHLHIGSPVLDAGRYTAALRITLDLLERLQRRGHAVRVIDLGGGFGADYESGQSPSPSDYANAIVPLMRPLRERGVRFLLEPGRFIAANAGVLLVRVIRVKREAGKTFVICDAGMNALLRPSHYDAFHFVWPAEPRDGRVPLRRAADPGLPGLDRCDVVGPLCETGDYLALDRVLPPLREGDPLTVFTAGAYGMSMSSRYNAQPLPAEVLVDGERAQLVRRRETLTDLVAHEMTPAPLAL